MVLVVVVVVVGAVVEVVIRVVDEVVVVYKSPINNEITCKLGLIRWLPLLVLT